MPKVYPLETVEKGLMLVATTGSTTIASRLMQEAGTPVPHQTLYEWKVRTHVDRYTTISTEIAPKLRERMAAQAESVIDELTALEHKAAEELKSQLPDLEGKDLAGALRNISTSKGINLQHAAALRDRPSIVVQHKYSIEQLDEMYAHVMKQAAIDAEAEPIDATIAGQLPSESHGEQRAHEPAV